MNLSKTSLPVNLDYSATTPLREEVLEEMKPYFQELSANPSAIYTPSQKVSSALRNARKNVAHIFHCTPEEIIFTGGGTESINLALRGIAFRAKKEGRGNHIITGPLEHSAARETLKQLEEYFDFQVSTLKCDEYGLINPKDLETAIIAETVLINIGYASGEIGTIQPIQELSSIARERGVFFHTDAVQTAGCFELDTESLGVDGISVSGHKIGGPKGVGALYIRKGALQPLPQMTGGSQERGRRAGTENVPGIIGFNKALSLCQKDDYTRLQALNTQFISQILSAVEGFRLIGHPSLRLPFHSAYVMKGLPTEKMLMFLDGQEVYASGGSACNVGNPTPGESFLNIGLNAQEALSILRCTTGIAITQEQLDYAVRTISGIVLKLRRK